MEDDAPFWERKALSEMNKEEWESLCDGCGRCCLLKLEDEDSGALAYTEVVCKYSDPESCQCTVYTDRKTLMPDCLILTPAHLTVENLAWFPPTCAYRMLSEGIPLSWWHPLSSGDPNTVYEAGVSIKHRVVSEDDITDDIQEYIVTWPEN
ncbi:MAG: YcgN family cysteine cluster protein [Methylococcales bacterium]|nr:YcgN family cysteine cluster protein [Methylococcales bacterium]